MNTTEYVSALDNVISTISYKEYLYYAKDNKLYKYANILNIPSIDTKSTLIVYPNPSSDFVQINTAGNKQMEKVDLFDINGKLVIDSFDYQNNKIDITKLNAGTYLAKIKIDGVIISKKIVKK
ncbi:hypothetical protein D3C85_1503550 [compost metagenome]